MTVANKEPENFKAASCSARVAIFGSEPAMLCKFHGPLVRELLKAGHSVTLLCPRRPGTEELIAQLEAYGAEWRELELRRASLNPLKDIRTALGLYKLLREARPCMLLAYTAKPIIYGMIIGLFAGVKRRYALITGLGYAFTNAPGYRRRLVRIALKAMYWLSLRLSTGVLFQNDDDRREFYIQSIMRRGMNAVVVDGCGVDTEVFAQTEMPAGVPTFIMVARLLADKGLREFAGAARRLKSLQDVRFVLVGHTDQNPAAIPIAEIEAWVREGVVEWLGHLSDVRSAISLAHVAVLPSYREGLPQSILEAMSMGRAVITTDVPGCRETVVPGCNGLLVAPRSVDELFEACKVLADDVNRIRKMGLASRQLAETRFEARKVAAATMTFMGLAVGEPPADLTPNG